MTAAGTNVTAAPPAERSAPFSAIHGVLRSATAIWTSPLTSGAAALAGYLLVAVLFNPRGLGQSTHPYFLYLADAFLQVQLHLATVPADTRDLVLLAGNAYLYWPPFPAVVFIPVMAVFGLGASDAVVSLVAGAVNVALVSQLLRELETAGVARLTPARRGWLTAFFAFGTVHVTLAPYANVWFTSQVIDFGLVAGAYVVALRCRGWQGAALASLLGGAAFLTRNPSIFALIWVALFYLRRESADGPRRLLVSLFAALVPVASAAGLLMLYNYARFGNPLDMGLAYHNMSPFFVQDFQQYGYFSLHYLFTNLYYYLLAFPYLALFGEQAGLYFWMGGSIFLMSPLFLYALKGVWRSRRSQGWPLALSFVVGLLPALLLMGTGYLQFGSRYSLDVTVPLLVATAIGIQGTSTRLIGALTLTSVFIFLPGTILLGNVVGRF